MMPKAILPRARSIVGLGGWVVYYVRSFAMLRFVAISWRVGPGRLTEHVRDKPVQWARYLVNTIDIQLTMRRCPPEADAAFFSDSYSLNRPVPGNS